MKRQYLALLVVLVAFIALSLWIASQTNLQSIESRITGTGNESHQGSDGIIEGGRVMPYLAITAVLVAAGITTYWILGKRSSR